MESNNSQPHEDVTKGAVFSHFGVYPQKIEKIKVGLDNEVYVVQVQYSEYIVRLNERDSLKGSDKYIPLFERLNIQVPKIVASDYSKKKSSYNWQIQTKLEGDDIQNVISTLTYAELNGIAKEIASIVKKLLVLPTNGMYGWMGLNESKLRTTLTGFVEGMFDTLKNRNEKTGAVKEKYIQLFENILNKYRDYFDSAPSQFYFDDMSSKNVIINAGKFSGIVDLDGVAYGDYLEGIGRIKASWYGTDYGDYYANAVMDNLDLNPKKREMVGVWALLNRIYWQGEIGIYSNSNSVVIDQKIIEKGETMIEGLAKELGVT